MNLVFHVLTNAVRINVIVGTSLGRPAEILAGRRAAHWEEVLTKRISEGAREGNCFDRKGSGDN